MVADSRYDGSEAVIVQALVGDRYVNVERIPTAVRAAEDAFQDRLASAVSAAEDRAAAAAVWT